MRGLAVVFGLACAACAEPTHDVRLVVHDRAAVGARADVEDSTDIEDSAVIEESAVIEDSTVIEDSADIEDSTDIEDSADIEDSIDVAEPTDVEVEADAAPAPCPDDMRQVGATCVDRWEAPGLEGALPLVMYTFDEAAAWCQARAKRLCWDDEWLAACAGEAGLAYPYGPTREPGRCNDDRTWRVYTQALLNGWPASVSGPDVASLEGLLDAARSRGAAGAAAADHVLALYQGTAAGARPGCVGAAGVEDLVGNVEEWVRRRDGGDGPQFSGALVGRYWAESRTCQSHVVAHGNAFRFYEIGFRCCRDAE